MKTDPIKPVIKKLPVNSTIPIAWEKTQMSTNHTKANEDRLVILNDATFGHKSRVLANESIQSNLFCNNFLSYSLIFGHVALFLFIYIILRKLYYCIKKAFFPKKKLN